jgi:hypothetical protein
MGKSLKIKNPPFREGLLSFDNDYFFVVSAAAGAIVDVESVVVTAVVVVVVVATVSVVIEFSSAFFSLEPQEAKPNKPAIIRTANNFFIF